MLGHADVESVVRTVKFVRRSWVVWVTSLARPGSSSGGVHPSSVLLNVHNWAGGQRRGMSHGQFDPML